MVRSAALALTASLGTLAACGFKSPARSFDDAPDAPDAPDAHVFDPAAECPAAYTAQLPSTAATSRYRVITALAQFWPHNATCNADRPGVTHAATLNTMAELLELKTLVDGLSLLDRYYLGGIQDPQATAVNQSWIWFTGTPLLQTAWHLPEGEPDDANGGTEIHSQQLVIFDRLLTYLHDATGTSTYGIVCECDNMPVTAQAQGFVDRDPNNPN
jgi:hypothetical protein